MKSYQFAISNGKLKKLKYSKPFSKMQKIKLDNLTKYFLTEVEIIKNNEN